MDMIYIWPDGSWMFDYEYSEMEYSWKGFDYMKKELPENTTDKQIDELALAFANNKRMGEKS